MASHLASQERSMQSNIWNCKLFLQMLHLICGADPPHLVVSSEVRTFNILFSILSRTDHIFDLISALNYILLSHILQRKALLVILALFHK